LRPSAALQKTLLASATAVLGPAAAGMEGRWAPSAPAGQAAGGQPTCGVPPAQWRPPHAGTVRLQFTDRQRLGGCVAWDRASGLLAIELQASAEDGSGDAAAVAILDPQAPEVWLGCGA
jgi:hypothetical protein